MPDVRFRRAEERDLPTLIRLFALPDGNLRDRDPLPNVERCYLEALEAMSRDETSRVIVAVDQARVLGAFQLTIIQHLAYRGGRVAQIENVIVEPDARGLGVGEAMMRFAIEEARRAHCFRVQLTSNLERTRAHRFYERLGFRPSHVGMKLAL